MADSLRVGGGNRSMGLMLIGGGLLVVTMFLVIIRLLMPPEAEDPGGSFGQEGGPITGTVTILTPLPATPLVPTAGPPPTQTVPPPPPPTATPGATTGLPPECWLLFLYHPSVASGNPQVIMYQPGGGVAYQPLSWALQVAQEQLQVPAGLTPSEAGRTPSGQPYYALNIDANSALYLRGVLYRGNRQTTPTSDGLCWSGSGWLRIRVPSNGIADPVAGK